MEALREKKDCKLFSLYTDVALFITAASKKSPAVLIFYHARSKNFEEKLEGLQNNIHVFFFF